MRTADVVAEREQVRFSELQRLPVWGNGNDHTQVPEDLSLQTGNGIVAHIAIARDLACALSRRHELCVRPR